MNRWTINSFLPAFLLWAICAGCSSSDDGEKIRTLIAKGAALAEAHDIGGMLELASNDVRAMPMDLDRRGITNLERFTGTGFEAR